MSENSSNNSKETIFPFDKYGQYFSERLIWSYLPKKAMVMILLVYSKISGTVLDCSEVEQYRGRGKESQALQRTWKWRHHLVLKKTCVFVELSTTVGTRYHSDWKGLNQYTQIVLFTALSWRWKHGALCSLFMHTHKFDSYNDKDSRKTSSCRASFPNIHCQILDLARDIVLHIWLPAQIEQVEINQLYIRCFHLSLALCFPVGLRVQRR